MLTASLRQQHAEIVADLDNLLRAIKGGTSGYDLRIRLLELGGRIGIHLAAEDRLVYPQLRASQDAAVSAMAKRLADEMGGLEQVLRDFRQRYDHAMAIDADRAGFATAFRAVFIAIAARMRIEDDELYTAVDRVAGNACRDGGC